MRGDLVEQLVLRVHVGGLEGRAREHRLPVQRGALALELGDSSGFGSSIRPNLPCGAIDIGDRVEVLVGLR